MKYIIDCTFSDVDSADYALSAVRQMNIKAKIQTVGESGGKDNRISVFPGYPYNAYAAYPFAAVVMTFEPNNLREPPKSECAVHIELENPSDRARTVSALISRGAMRVKEYKMYS